MDDFTFPATAAAAEPADPLCLHHHRLPSPHLASSSLWFHAAAVAAKPVAVVSRAVGMEEQEPAPGAGRPAEGERGEDEEGDEEVVRGGGMGGEDKMDLLWENFNEELEALRWSGSCSKAAAAASGLELSDTESEPAERGRGCAPMLRVSSRAGGTRHYGRATNWVLLMRIFRRLFVVEKTITAARRRQAKP